MFNNCKICISHGCLPTVTYIPIIFCHLAMFFAVFGNFWLNNNHCVWKLWGILRIWKILSSSIKDLIVFVFIFDNFSLWGKRINPICDWADWTRFQFHKGWSILWFALSHMTFHGSLTHTVTKCTFGNLNSKPRHLTLTVPNSNFCLPSSRTLNKVFLSFSLATSMSE